MSAVADTKVYGSGDPVLGTSHEGFLAADLGAGKITFSASRAGGESGRLPTGITPAAADGNEARLLSNYDVHLETRPYFRITKKAITGTFLRLVRQGLSDGKTRTLTTTDRSLVGCGERRYGQPFGGSAWGSDTKNVGTDKTVTLIDATLSGADAGNYYARVGGDLRRQHFAEADHCEGLTTGRRCTGRLILR